MTPTAYLASHSGVADVEIVNSSCFYDVSKHNESLKGLPMSSKAQPLFRTFAQAKPYEQNEPGEAKFNWLIEKNELPGMCVGRVRLVGPIHKTPTAHEELEQAYIILSGSGTIHLGDQHHHVSEPGVVIIPKNTLHSVELTQGQSLEYLFINQYLAE